MLLLGRGALAAGAGRRGYGGATLLLLRPRAPTMSTTATAMTTGNAPMRQGLRRPRPGAFAGSSFSATPVPFPVRRGLHARPSGGRGGGGGGRQGLSPEQLQFLFRVFGRVLGSALHFIRSRGLHRSRPALVAGILLVPTGMGGAFLLSHLEAAPLTGRSQLVFLDAGAEAELGAMAAAQVAREERQFVLPRTAPETVLVHDVALELIQALRLESQGDPAVQRRIQCMDWQVTVVRSDVANAFVVPNGAIFVYTGLLEQLGTRGALAFVLGHEISHALARHSVEKIGVLCLGSMFVEAVGGFLGPSAYRGLQHLLFPLFQGLVLDLPFSRKLEAEADALGLRLMAQAGYDPREGVEAWRRMEQEQEQEQAAGGGQKQQKQQKQQQPWEFLSTHPAHASRIAALTAQLPAAQALQAQAAARKRRLGERLPDSHQPLPSTGSSSAAAAALLRGRREASAAVALRASSLVAPMMEAAGFGAAAV